VSTETKNSVIPNVLAERYASPAVRDIFSAEGRIVLEREFWIAVMKAQRELGIDIPEATIAAYESVKNNVDLGSIMARERVTRHDVKARIEEFCDLAGHEHIHKGMTSRDLTENVEQLQVFRALQVIRTKTAAAVIQLGKAADANKHQVITARTHNVAAQVTTLGRRLAMFGEELQDSLAHLTQVIDAYPARGLKGAVGTQLDQINLFNGDTEKAADLERRVVKHLGISTTYVNTGQVYPRSLDQRVVSALVGISSAPSSFSKTLRIMAGHELMSEGFAKGQVGSSAMPHKMNSRSCERINGFHTLLQGYQTMAGSLAGDQWNEGDVSCSVVRRVMLPDAFFAIDGLLETFLTVLGQMQVFPAVIEKENAYYLPFLMTTTFLMEAVKAGVGRETAHEVIKEHAIATVFDLRKGAIRENDLLDRLANDGRLDLSREALQTMFESGKENCGNAINQTEYFVKATQALAASNPDAAAYAPGDIL
jgi:adenylosuccinate lyase